MIVVKNDGEGRANMIEVSVNVNGIYFFNQMVDLLNFIKSNYSENKFFSMGFKKENEGDKFYIIVDDIEDSMFLYEEFCISKDELIIELELALFDNFLMINEKIGKDVDIFKITVDEAIKPIRKRQLEGLEADDFALKSLNASCNKLSFVIQ